jgi:hypothetical protein
VAEFLGPVKDGLAGAGSSTLCRAGLTLVLGEDATIDRLQLVAAGAVPMVGPGLDGQSPLEPNPSPSTPLDLFGQRPTVPTLGLGLSAARIGDPIAAEQS